MQRTFKTHSGQAGFSLLEIIIGIAIATIIAGVLISRVNITGSKGKILFQKVAAIGDEVKTGTVEWACLPTKLVALNEKAKADESFCGIDNRDNWSKAALTGEEFDAAGDMKLTSLVPGATLSIQKIDVATGTQYVLRAKDIPNEMLDDAKKACNGNATATGRCTIAKGTGKGTYDYVFVEEKNS